MSAQNSPRRMSRLSPLNAPNINIIGIPQQQRTQIRKQEGTKLYTANEIQKQIENIIQSANDDIRDIQVTKSTGMLGGQYKQKLLDTMKSNLTALEKLERLSKNPFLHNDFLYNRIMKSAINYYNKSVTKGASYLNDKIEWIESQYYHWLTKLIKILQYFQQNDLLHMKQEVANVFNWYQNFTKFLEGMKLLEYPIYGKGGKKKSTEIFELDKLSFYQLSLTKPRERETEEDKQEQSFDPSQINKELNNLNLQIGLSPFKLKNREYSFKVQKLGKKEFVNHSQINVEPLTTKNKISNKQLNKLNNTDMNINVQKLEEIEDFPVDSITKGVDLNIHDHRTPDINIEKLQLTRFDFKNKINTPFRILPRIDKTLRMSTFVGTNKDRTNPRSHEDDDDLILPNFKPHRKDSQPILSSSSSIDGPSGTTSKLNEKSISSSTSSDSQDLQDIKKPEDLRKKYLIEAPLSFKMNEPPKIVDLTSDFFEKDTDQLQKKKLSRFASSSSPRKSSNSLQKPKIRLIINNPKQNAIMVEQGKKKIGQLKNFYGKMISDVLMREFEMMFAPLDENQDNNDYNEMSASLNKQQSLLNQTQGVMPPNMIHNDNMNLGQDGGGKFEFKQSGMGMIRRTAQDDYRYQQLNEIQDLKNLLVKKELNVNHKVLQRAILMPEDQVFDSSNKHYPNPMDGLMENPFPKSKMAKKKKKKRKIRNATSVLERF